MDVKFTLLSVLLGTLAGERVRNAEPARGNRIVKEFDARIPGGALVQPVTDDAVVQSQKNFGQLSGPRMSAICLHRLPEKS
jgi:hypothetical protein